MAHKKGVGSSDNGRDSKSKRLGVKLFGGQKATAGTILIRQRGTKYLLGKNVYLGKDFTVHAKIDGKVVYTKGSDDRTYVHVIPFDVAETVADVATIKKAAKPAPAPKAATPKAVAAPKTPAPVVEAPAPVKEVVVEAPAPVVEVVVEAPAPVKEVVVEAPTPVVEVAVEAPAPVVEVVVEAPAPVVEEIPVAEVATETPAAIASTTDTDGDDNLKVVEGIGPKIEQLLKEGGIPTWRALSNTSVERLKEILAAAGARYAIHDPSTWPKQAALAADGKWDELEELQERLNGGKE